MPIFTANPRERASMFPMTRYGASHFGKTLLWATTEVYAVYSLTEFIGLSPVVAGITFLSLLIWSAFCDLAVGYWLGRTADSTLPNTLMRWCAVLSAAAFALSFAPLGAGPGYAYLALFATALFRPLFAFADVPHNGLLRELGTCPAEWVRLSMLRLYSGAAAGLVLSAGGMLMLAGEADPAQFRLFAIGIASLGVGLFLLSPPVRPDGVTRRGGRAIAVSAVTHGSVLMVLAATMSGIVGFSLMLKLFPYLAKFGFGDLGWAGRAMLAVTLGKLAAIPLWYWLERRLGASVGSIIAYAVLAVAAALIGRTLTIGLPLDLLLGMFGAAMGGASMLSWALIAQAVEQVEAQFGGSAQSLLFGLFTCLSKLAVGLGGTILALGVGWIGTDALPVAGGLALCLTASVMGLAAAAILATILRPGYAGLRPGAPASTTKRARVLIDEPPRLT